MAGLLDRALRIRELESARENSEGVTREERERVLAEIESLFLAKRPAAERPAARGKRGLAAPLVANAAGAVFLLVGFLLFGGKGGLGRTELAAGQATDLAMESRVIEAVRRSASEELSLRERRIAEIEAELGRMAGAAAGGSATAVPDAAREAQARALRAELAALEAARAAAREAPPAPEPGAAAKTAPEARLEELARGREEYAFFLGQLRELYGEARRLAVAGNASAALERSAAASRLAEGPAAALLEPPELAELLRAGNAALGAALGSAIDSAAALAAAAGSGEGTGDLRARALAETAARARSLAAAGDEAGAERLYLQALAALPPAAEADAAIRAYEARRAEELAARLKSRADELAARAAALGGRVAELEAAGAGGETLGAEQAARLAELERREAAEAAARAELEARLAAAENGLRTALEASRGEAAYRAARERELRELEASLALGLAEARERLAPRASALETAATNGTRATAESGPEGERDLIIELLEAKVRLRELAGAEEGRRVSPGFYAELERYFAASSLAERSAGEEAALLAASAALEELRLALGLPEAETAASAPAPLPARTRAAADYLARLEGILAALVAKAK